MSVAQLFDRRTSDVLLPPATAKQWLALIALIAAITVMSQTAVAQSRSSASLDEPVKSGVTPAEFNSTVKPFLTRYCYSCHGQKKQKGDRRFDTLTGRIVDDNSLVDLQDVLDQLNLSEMPPEDSPQPSVAERRQVIRWLTSEIDRYHSTRQTSDGASVLRRLNSREYRNTIRDLFRLNMTMFDPAAAFPRDQTTEHLDTVGDTLVTSGALLQQYLIAAEQVVDKAVFPLKKPPVQKWEFHDGFRQQPEIDQVHGKVNGFKYMTLYDVVGADKPEGAYGPIQAFAEGVPYDGYYEIRLNAEALNRQHPYDVDFLGTDPAESLRLGIVAGHRDAGTLHLKQPVEPLLAEVELADEQRWYTVRVWLDTGFTPRFTFRNGLMDVRSIWGKLASKYADQFPKRKSKGIVESRFNGIKYGKLPQIRIHDIEIEGPLYESWPTKSQQAVFGKDSDEITASESLTDAQMVDCLTGFASRAYRRPVSEDELHRVIQVVKAREEGGRTRLEALCDGLKTVLCSPEFIYLQQGNEESQPSSYALASRLSYFLWSTLPDDELLRLASDNRLNQPDVLAAQVDRMLDDQRSDAFIDGFLGSWLTLRELGATAPDRSAFRRFYHYDLDSAMRQETKLFVRELIEKNLSIDNFLDSDFTFVNKRLAEHYQLKHVPPGSSFERVSLTDGRRGGLLGQASILTVTANGIDTSPIVRGVWLLENILGTPPSPPPPDVEPIDPDIRGATTIRDQLEKHRSIASCNDCHRRIDPLGFALENFDPIGGWRTSYGRNRKIDPSGKLADGQEFAGVEEFKKLLLGRKDLFARALTEKLLAYAMGRHTQLADRPHVDQIVNELIARGGGLRDLIFLVVLSEPFRSP